MTVFTVGKARIARIEENLMARLIAPATSFPNSTTISSRGTPHGWRRAITYVASGFIKFSVHSWLLQIGGQNILIGRLLRQQQDSSRAAVLEPARHALFSRLAAVGRAAAREFD